MAHYMVNTLQREEHSHYSNRKDLLQINHMLETSPSPCQPRLSLSQESSCALHF